MLIRTHFQSDENDAYMSWDKDIAGIPTKRCELHFGLINSLHLFKTQFVIA